MRQQLPLFFILSWCCWAVAATVASSVSGQPPLDIYVSESFPVRCRPLLVEETLLLGSLCFHLYSELEKDPVVVEFVPVEQQRQVDWELHKAHLQLGDGSETQPQSTLTRLVLKKEDKRATAVQLSCAPHDDPLPIILHASAKKRLPDGSSSELSPIQPMEFLVSCSSPKSEPAIEEKPKQNTNNLRQPQQSQQQDRRRDFVMIPPVLYTDPCPSYPDANTANYYNLTEDFLRNAAQAFELITVVTKEQVGPIETHIATQRQYYFSFMGWSDYNDQALVAKTTDTSTCFAIFMSTEGNNLLDQFQNIIILNEPVPGTDCVVRQGYSSAYFADYYDEFRAEVDTCVNSCGNTTCPLILAGHSQGGAVAVVASADLNEYNPTTITFGAPRAIHDDGAPCNDAKPENHYRFINSVNGVYDRVATQVNFFFAKHVGHTLVLDDTNFPIHSLGFNHDDSYTNRGDGPHLHQLYEARVQAMVDRGCFPIPVVPN